MIIDVVKTFCFDDQVKSLGQPPRMIPMAVGEHHSINLFRYIVGNFFSKSKIIIWGTEFCENIAKT